MNKFGGVVVRDIDLGFSKSPAPPLTSWWADAKDDEDFTKRARAEAHRMAGNPLGPDKGGHQRGRPRTKHTAI